MSDLSQALLGGIDLGGRQANQAMEMALSLDGARRRQVLEDLQMRQGEQHLSDEQRQSQWATEDRPAAVRHRDLGVQQIQDAVTEHERHNVWEGEDRPAAVRTRDLHLGDLEAENQARVEALASTHADQRYHAWEAEQLGMFQRADPETGLPVSDVAAHDEFHAMDPRTQATAIAAQRLTAQKQKDWQERQQLERIKQQYRDRAMAAQVAQIWASHKHGLIDDAERDRRLDELGTTGHVSAARFARQEDPQALHDQILAGGGSEEQAKAAALQAVAKRGGASQSLFALPKIGAGVLVDKEHFDNMRAGLSPRVAAIIEPYVEQGRPLPTTIMAMAGKPDKEWNEAELEVSHAESSLKHAEDMYKLALKGVDKDIVSKAAGGDAKATKKMAPVLQAQNRVNLARIQRDAAHDAAARSHQWKPPVKGDAAAPAPMAAPEVTTAPPAAADPPVADQLRRALFDQAMKDAGDNATDDEIQRTFERLWDEAQRGDER